MKNRINQQQVDKEGFAILKSDKRTKYSTIDQYLDGNAHPIGYKNRGPFFNRNASKAKLTDVAKKILHLE